MVQTLSVSGVCFLVNAINLRIFYNYSIMRPSLLLIALVLSSAAFAQEERDSVMKKCPVYITDTVSANNFFIEGQACTMSVSRVKGDLKVVVQQRDQFLSVFFRDKKLKTGKYKIKSYARDKDETEVKYSFRSGDQVSYVTVSSGTIDVSFDKEKELWKLKLNGMIANMVERSVTYYRVRTELIFP